MENQTKKTVAIIGAGPAGLISAKEAIECGLTPTIFEKTGHIGGLWHPKTGSTWDKMQTNITNFSCCFSDYPWPESAPAYLSLTEMNKYLSDYFEHHKLRDYTHFNANVENVAKNPTGNTWIITFTQETTTKSQEFDYVIVACGVFSKPHFPPIQGKELFKGQILHSADYKRKSNVKGDNIVVVGAAFSGSQIATDLAEGGKMVTNVISNPVWIIKRWVKDGMRDGNPLIPFDMAFFTRARDAASKTKKVLPEQASVNKHAAFNSLSNQAEVCEDLKIEVDSQPKISIVDNYLESIQSGKIKIKKGGIVSMDANGLVMKDGSLVPADCIIFSTGFLLQLPFFDNKIKEALSYIEEDQFQPALLHECTFHPDLPNMGFVGIYRGPYFSTLELQARWVTLAFTKGGDMYPSTEDMITGIEKERRIRQMVPRPQFPHGNYIEFADSIAKKIGVFPDLEKIEKEDPELYRMLWNNMLISSHYRLQGFGSNRMMALDEIKRLDKFLKSCNEKSEENPKF